MVTSVVLGHDGYDWLTFAAQAGGALATVITALVAIAALLVSLWLALVDRKRSREVTARAEDELRRNREAVLRAQAELVTVWLDQDERAGRGDVMLSNASTGAIYDVAIGYGVAYGAGTGFLKGDWNSNDALLFINRLAPGSWAVSGAPGYPGGGMHIHVEAAIAFRDAAGRFWARDATGELQQIEEHPYEYVQAMQPISPWATIRRASAA
ncbi:hypothetical protein D7I44_07610 [Gryllotalpicola protaetiae]|uniref:Uncharacterized protein n=2 Tax=Gryllotalpicola protaetiae TaxID=2419771 RepID=A0A387BHW2_9MICO|nr:hypothetical protein D7I44_07610 [Gryllotalpicola protaetiae]